MAKTEVFDIGDKVNCDLCNADWPAGRQGDGGMLVMSKAVCPTCAPDYEKALKKYSEEHFIRDRQPAGVTFHAWVMQLRGGDNTVKVTTFNSMEEFIDAQKAR